MIYSKRHPIAMRLQDEARRKKIYETNLCPEIATEPLEADWNKVIDSLQKGIISKNDVIQMIRNGISAQLAEEIVGRVPKLVPIQSPVVDVSHMSMTEMRKHEPITVKFFDPPSAVENPTEGQIVFDSKTNMTYMYHGLCGWTPYAASGSSR